MQLKIRGQETTVVDCQDNETIQHIKVEKQEKSKKKTGRAKRRIQYNRRFVNVVQTFGRRRGPNANTNS
ncbi:40S ribosomal protein S30 [Harpegnathos saltator]|uniref:40S ribosomal protein S30 n=1 Tax=Harpegnathos saltator TaxID=610380 RepID=E2B703_HARSA|nr:40S ribosomal protein S30 [Harpegnathos saltator]